MTPEWFKSSHSSNGGNCVEIAANLQGVVPVRDSKDPHGPALTFPAEGFTAFIAELKSGGFEAA
ncbi:DUF397 domain-containing protein [Kitasatospora sp. NBC_01287]|uniref:DUF397 domain-containing protein n=1 Tax=Kitasatospora sp. NBC_01287 TaxID=2903573 RepID=UPI0022543EBA|nr:DUF397 domain-containing protein [Kitasatospora sp. NBC_01287]MCX4744247.1 DUF397 domain-containing protein [Kitasatospora sp. NBC_01287]